MKLSKNNRSKKETHHFRRFREKPTLTDATSRRSQAEFDEPKRSSSERDREEQGNKKF